ncbi:hypothetical protein DFJ58DRAFT_848422 [Suillus subalutaceus]|uniref:uncharacterized protein n=1 Tax=Suillus subalutaceus TaxID=48586 RepID=UPI001B875255|nr:uncharacterized protein DFJ58DRAFT_848422 [Suillus subalutaceus]KAG1830674.1 hypothetical protein DFJ58DRAFT_848422 [Suillus subalutaceus]
MRRDRDLQLVAGTIVSSTNQDESTTLTTTSEQSGSKGKEREQGHLKKRPRSSDASDFRSSSLHSDIILHDTQPANQYFGSERTTVCQIFTSGSNCASRRWSRWHYQAISLRSQFLQKLVVNLTAKVAAQTYQLHCHLQVMSTVPPISIHLPLPREVPVTFTESRPPFLTVPNHHGAPLLTQGESEVDNTELTDNIGASMDEMGTDPGGSARPTHAQPRRERTGTPKSTWNISATKVFVRNFIAHHPNFHYDAVKKAFSMHLRSLRRIFKQTGLDEAALKARQKEDRRKERKRSFLTYGSMSQCSQELVLMRAVRRLPCNAYHAEWYDGLDQYDREELDRCEDEVYAFTHVPNIQLASQRPTDT